MLLKPKTYKLKTNQKGFTLLEVLLVIAIIGIVSVAGGVYVGNVVSDTVLEEVASAVIADLKNAQAKAINGVDAKRWGVCFRNPTSGPNDDKYEIALIDSGTDACNPGSDPSTFFLQEGVEFSNPASGTTDDVVFEKISGGALEHTSLELSLRGDIRVINITTAGRIY